MAPRNLRKKRKADTDDPLDPSSQYFMDPELIMWFTDHLPHRWQGIRTWAQMVDAAKTGVASAMNRHMSASASSGSAGAICSTMARRWVSRSVTSALRFFQVMKLRARAMLVSRLVISRAASLGLWAPASASRSLRLAAALPVLTSISNCARRSAPSASRFFALRVVFDAIG